MLTGKPGIVIGGRSDLTILASGMGWGDTGGGLFAFDGRGVERIDYLSAGGLFVADDRLLRSVQSAGPGGELLVYDDRGVERYLRIDALDDCHDIAWDGRHFVAVSTLSNAILWIAPDGQVVRTWQAPGESDAWHLNSLAVRDGRLLVSAFGRFRGHREWISKAGEPTGIVFDVETGEDLITGLSCPHTPRFFDDACAICNSVTGQLVQVDPATGAVLRSVQLNGWTRGMVVGDDYLYVGVSAQRHTSPPGATASIAVMCRRTWALLDRIAVPSREIYDLVAVPPPLLEGVRRGFRTNPARDAELDQLALFQRVGIEPVRLWATGDPLPREACKVRLEADVPASLDADAYVELACTVDNLGAAFLVSAQPNPVSLSYKWLDRRSGQVIEGIRSPLPGAVRPGEPVACRMMVMTPSTPGDYQLCLTLVQEFVAWFDDLDPANGCKYPVRIMAAAPPTSLPREEAA